MSAISFDMATSCEGSAAASSGDRHDLGWRMMPEPKVLSGSVS
jgi:hypothetical protein